jgi:hypothetical protein
MNNVSSVNTNIKTNLPQLNFYIAFTVQNIVFQKYAERVAALIILIRNHFATGCDILQRISYKFAASQWCQEFIKRTTPIRMLLLLRFSMMQWLDPSLSRKRFVTAGCAQDQITDNPSIAGRSVW